jgi:(p)ppGpp synthase/HD superfamily hydrolase
VVQRPKWVAGSPLLIRAYALAAEACIGQRAGDGAPLLQRAIEAAERQHDAGADQPTVAAALLRPAVEAGAVDERRLAAEMGGGVAALVRAQPTAT